MNSTRFSIDRKTGMLIAKNLIVMLVLVIVALFSSFSWFTQKTEAKASGLAVSCEAPDGIEVAIVEHEADPPKDSDYSTSITLDETSFLAKLTLSEVTSDGQYFYRPALTQLNGVASPDPTKTWEEASPGQDFVCFDLYIRTKTQKKIYLDAKSNFSSVADRLSWEGDSNTETNDNASTYGYFSRDAIVGATRASIVGYNNNNESSRKMLWITRPDIYLHQDGTFYDLYTNLDDNSYKTYTHNFWDENQEPATVTEAVASVFNPDNNTCTLGQNILLTSFDSSTEKADYDFESKYYYTHVVFNAWIEGEDSEARLALSGGKFKINLTLSSDNTKSDV